MIFGKDKGEFDFDSFKNDVASAAEPLVDAVNSYNPNKKKRRYKSSTADLHDSASLFFQAAADTLNERSSSSKDSGKDSGFDLGATVKDMKLDKKAQQAGKAAQDAAKDAGKKGGWLFGAAGDAFSDAQDSVKDAKLDKKLGKLADSAANQVKDAKLDKKLGKLADDAASQVKDLKLDKKLADLTGSAADQFTGLKLDKKTAKLVDATGKQIKNAKLDKKLGKLADDANSQIASLKLDKKAAKLADQAGKQVKDLKLDKNAAKLAANIGSSAKDSPLDKMGDVAGTVGGVLLTAAATVGDAVKDAHLDKKFNDVAGTVGDAVKDAHLDKKLGDFGDSVAPIAANVVETAGQFAGQVADNVNSFIKDNKLDKKAGQVAGNVSGQASSLLSLAGDKAAQTLKDAKLDKKLADAQLPERFFEAANIIPGVTVSNPKKAAKSFRKRRKQFLKDAGKQQKQLGKVLAVKQKEAGKLLNSSTKDAQKFIEARRKDIETGKISVPFYEPPKKQGINWGRIALIGGGAGFVVGGLAANNARIWSAIPPLESKLPGENKYFRSRQGIVFYKESGEGETPVVFIHGIGAGNTSYEWSQNFGPLSEQYKTYAYDLLGFGNSDRPSFHYTSEVYIKQLTEFLDEVVKKPAYVVASSLAASYAVQVAYRRPELIQKLVLVSPTGINRVAGNNGVQLLPPFLYFLLRSPILGKAIYAGVASRKYVRSYMENQMFLDKSQVSEEMVEQYYVAAHQPGAEYPAYSFFTGQLNAEIGQTLGRIDKPILIVQGKQDKQTSPEEGETLRRQNQSARLINLEGARLLPHWEKATEFNKAVLNFLGSPDKPSTVKLSASDKSGVAAGASGTERKSHDKAPSAVEDAVSKVQDTVKQAAASVQDKAGEVADKVKDSAGDAVSKVQETAGQVASQVPEVAGKVQEAAGNVADQAKDKAGEAASKVQDTVKQATDKVASTGSKAQDKAADAKDKVQEVAEDAGSNVEQAAKKLADQFVDQAKQEQAGAEKPKARSAKGQSKDSGEEQTADAAEPAVEYHDDIDLEKELKAHRETFIGDEDTGAALVEDKDHDGVDDRRMGGR